MYDSETLRPVITAVIVYNILLWALPQVFKQPTGIKVFDDMMMLVVDDLVLLARTISNCDAGAVVIAVVDDLIHCKL